MYWQSGRSCWCADRAAQRRCGGRSFRFRCGCRWRSFRLSFVGLGTGRLHWRGPVRRLAGWLSGRSVSGIPCRRSVGYRGRRLSSRYFRTHKAGRDQHSLGPRGSPTDGAVLLHARAPSGTGALRIASMISAIAVAGPRLSVHTASRTAMKSAPALVSRATSLIAGA